MSDGNGFMWTRYANTILVTGGAGLHRFAYLRVPARPRLRSAVRGQFLHRHARKHRPSAGEPAFRSDAARHHVSALCSGVRHLQSRLPGFADPLSARSGANHQGERARRDQHARTGEEVERGPFSRHRPARSTAIPWCIRRSNRIGGNVNTIGPRACYDEGKRCAETLFFDYHRQHKLPIKVVRIFNTYGPRMHPHDGRVVTNFIVQGPQG